MASTIKVNEIQNLAGNTALTIDGNGYTKTLTPLFWADRTSNYTAGSANNSLELVYDSALVNVGNHYDTSTGRFTAPITGIYELAWASIANTNNTVYRYTLHKNGSLFDGKKYQLRIDTGSNSSDYGTSSEYCIYAPLNSGDYVSIFVENNTESNITAYGNGDYRYTYFRGKLVG